MFDKEAEHVTIRSGRSVQDEPEILPADYRVNKAVQAPMKEHVLTEHLTYVIDPEE